MKLTLVIEAAKGSDIVQKIIGWMQRRRLAEIMAEPDIQELYQPLYQRHLDSIALIRDRARQEDGVVFFDLAGEDMEGYNKFIPYYLFPVLHLHGFGECFEFPHEDLGRLEPWTAETPRHNLATICERYGGGGHARVGAISLEPGALEKARARGR